MGARVRSESSFVMPVGRLSYPTLFHKRAAKDGDRESYSTAFVLPVTAKTDPAFKALFDEVLRVGREAFGPGYDAGVKNGKYKFPFHFGGGVDKGYAPDDIYFSASSSTVKPKVVDAMLQPVEEDDERVFGGVYARISVTPYSYDNKSKGVAIGLNNVQILRPGEPFNGIRVAPEDEFSVDEDAVGDLSDIEGTRGNPELEEQMHGEPEAEKPKRGRPRKSAAAAPDASASGKPLSLSDLMGA